MAQHEQDRRDVAGVIAPPPLIYLGFLLAGLVLNWIWPSWPSDAAAPAFRYGLGGVLVAAGLAIAAAGIRQFRRAGTEVRPHRPSTALVTGGVFRFSRNPLYLSLTSVYLGVALAAGSVWALGLLAPALGLMRYGVIAREETYLERKFGDAYRDYKRTVRRWL
jgi:protein-S-isoprenylcysteine O-methyltransferase Ste14